MWVPSLPTLRFLRFHQGNPPRTAWWALFLHLGIPTGIPAATDLPLLPLPARPYDAPGGKAVALAIARLDPAAREAVLQQEILSGNVPDFQRRFAAVDIQEGENRLVLWVAPDYLAVGSDSDYFRTPLTPASARTVADHCHCTLPTRKMVDAIYHAAAVKLNPRPRPPRPDMTTVPAFLDYQKTIQAQRAVLLNAFPLGTLVAGHQKDVVLTPQLTEGSGKVAIYGWHCPNGTPIQPLYTGHAETWVDYSHGIRLVAQEVSLNGQASDVARILADPQTASLLSDEPFAATAGSPAPLKTEAERAAVSGETLVTLEPEPGVRIVINRPAPADSSIPSHC